jgi:MFS family permease
MMQNTQQDLYLTLIRKNITRIYFINFCRWFLFLMPFVVPYFTKIGMNMEQIFMLQGIYGFVIVLFEVPSGYFADLFGRKLSLLLGYFFIATSFTWLIFGQSYWQLIFFEILLGIGFSLVSGSDLSIVFDSILELKENYSTTKVLANFQFSAVIAQALAAIIASYLVLNSYEYLIYAQCLTSWIPFGLVFLLTEPKIKRMDKNKLKDNFIEIYNFIFKKDYLLLLIFINLVVWSMATYIAVWVYQKYWMDQQVKLFYFGFIWAGYHVLVGVTGLIVPRLSKLIGLPFIFVFCALFSIFGYYGMSFTQTWGTVMVGCLFQISRGLTQVVFKEAYNDRLESKFRATANSILSMCFRLVFFIIAYFIGSSIDQFGIPVVLRNLGHSFLILFVIILIPVLFKIKKGSHQ